MIRTARHSYKVTILHVAVDSGLFPAEHVDDLFNIMDEQPTQESNGSLTCTTISFGGSLLRPRNHDQ